MSELDVIRQSLEQNRDDIASAVKASNQAHQDTQQKADEFAGLGLDGVTAVLGSTGDCLLSVSGDLNIAHDSATASLATLSTVSDGSNVSATITGLSTAEGQRP